MQPVVKRISNALEAGMQAMSDEDLRAKRHFRERITNGEPLDDLLPEAFTSHAPNLGPLAQDASLRRPS